MLSAIEIYDPNVVRLVILTLSLSCHIRMNLIYLVYIGWLLKNNLSRRTYLLPFPYSPRIFIETDTLRVSRSSTSQAEPLFRLVLLNYYFFKDIGSPN